MKPQINLLAALPKPPKVPFSLPQQAIAVFCFIVLLVMTTFSNINTNRKKELELKSMKAKHQTLVETLSLLGEKNEKHKKGQALDDEVSSLESRLAQQEELTARLTALGGSNTHGFSFFMKLFSIPSIKTVWLKRFELRRGGESIVLEGSAYDSLDLTDYLAAITHQPGVTGLRFRVVNMEQDPENTELMHFTARTHPDEEGGEEQDD